MKIVKLKGGLGNQMFQYAFAKLLQKETGSPVKIDLSSYGELKGDTVRKPRILKFNISLPVATQEELMSVCKISHGGDSQSNIYRIGLVLESILNKKYLFERNHAGCSAANMKKCEFFDGYWQDWRNVDSIMPELREEFTPVERLGQSTEEKLAKIEGCNSVFVGVRRGDYLTVRPEHYGTFDQEYYDRAMEKVSQMVTDPVFFIFSNDINWVQKNMDFSKWNVVYITETIDDFEDFILMSRCKHSIIPNSTYHWWGARLNEYEGKVVVAPSKWFVDDAPINILPDRWEKV